MKLHTYYRRSPVHMLRRSELIEAAEMAVGRLHMNATNFSALHTRRRSFLITLTEIAAKHDKVIWDKLNGDDRT